MKYLVIFLSLALSFSFHSCDDIEPAELSGANPVEENPEPTDPEPVEGPIVFGQPFIKNSELWNLIRSATHNSGDPMTDIVCINFVYPFVIKKYDATMTPVEMTTIDDDPEFYNYLTALPLNQAVSLSYPISSTNSNGEILTVNNNAELIDALKACHQEAVILYCSGVFCSGDEPEELPDCYWQVPYYPGTDNTYAGGIFVVAENGSLVFHYNGQSYPGTWVFLFVNDAPHININLEGTSAVANYWNIDREIYTNNTDMTLMSDPMDIRLEKLCARSEVYAVGDTGPANGIVFYDKGEYSEGWRYMEVTATDMPSVQWGCQGSTANSMGNNNRGMINSARIGEFHETSGFYQNPTNCSAQNDGTSAVKSALSWQSAGIDDWYLPSEQEMQLVYTNLTAAGLGNFSANSYWTSTEQSANEARVVNFSNGNASNQLKTATTVKTRAIRYF